MDMLMNNLMNKLDMTTIMYILAVFVFLKYGIKELNIIYLLIISFVVVYYFKNNMFKKNDTTSSKTSLGYNIDELLQPLEKYDNDNLLIKIRKNYKNILKSTNKNNISMRDMNNISFLKDKILNYINELNVSYDDKNIDNIYSSISNNIDSLIKKI
jgi:hypothetical protein